MQRSSRIMFSFKKVNFKTISIDASLPGIILLGNNVELVVVFKSINENVKCFGILLPTLPVDGQEVLFKNLCNEQITIASGSGIIDGRKGYRFLAVNSSRNFGFVTGVGWCTFD